MHRGGAARESPGRKQKSGLKLLAGDPLDLTL